MWINGKNEDEYDETYLTLLVYRENFPFGFMPLFHELSEEDIIEELDTWDELEKWLKDPANDEYEEVHLSMAIERHKISYPDSIDIIGDYVSILEVKDIRNVEFTDELKKQLESNAYDYLVDYYQELNGIPKSTGRVEKIKIRKLFHKYDIDIDLANPVNILIGANGIGKTTIIKLLDNYYNKNYIDMLAAPFEGIDYDYIRDAGSLFQLSEGGLIKVNNKYEDFFPDKSTVINSFINQYSTYVSNKLASFTAKESDEDKIERIGNRFSQMIEELDANGLYGQFLYNFYRNKRFTMRINDIVEKWFDLSFLYEFSFVEKCDLLKDIDIFAHSKQEALYLQDRVRVIGNEISPTEEAVYYIDFVQPISLDNNTVVNSGFYKPDLDWIATEPTPEYSVNPNGKVSIFVSGQGKQQYDPNTVHESISHFGTPVFKARTHYNSFINNHNDLFREILLQEYNSDNTTIKYLIYKNGYAQDMSHLDEMIENRLFRINDVIHQNYYTDDFILDVNNRTIAKIKLYFDLLDRGPEDIPYDSLVDEYNSLIDRISEDFASDYIEYVHPILVRNSFYCIDIKKITDSGKAKPYKKDLSPKYKEDYQRKSMHLFEEVVYLRTFVSFLDEIIPELKDEGNRTNKIQNYEKILKKYLAGKYVIITPSGLKIRDSLTNRSGSNVLILYDSDEIDLSIVSSGERKIIILFALQIFYSECTFLLDEPELSLSILWQESLVPDLIANGNNKFVIATHSPYIAKDESIQEYIKYLPQEEG